MEAIVQLQKLAERAVDDPALLKDPEVQREVERLVEEVEKRHTDMVRLDTNTPKSLRTKELVISLYRAVQIFHVDRQMARFLYQRGFKDEKGYEVLCSWVKCRREREELQGRQTKLNQEIEALETYFSQYFDVLFIV